MTVWSYDIDDIRVILEDSPRAEWAALAPVVDIVGDDDLMVYVDTEVHRLNLLIEKAQSDIYKLRKCTPKYFYFFSRAIITGIN